MSQTENAASPTASIEEIQQGWNEIKLRVGQLEAEKCALEQENKNLKFLLERSVEHRQKSHSELVLLLAGLVSKLPINDIGVVVSKLVEHNSHVTEISSALIKGKIEASLPQPAILKALDHTKRELLAGLKPLIEELTRLNAPLETELLQSLETQPESFFSAPVVRATRCFIKGQLPRERILREFGDPGLVYFNDLTTDRKLNPNPKPEEIVLCFKSDFEALFQQNGTLTPEKRQQLFALYQKVQQSRTSTDQAASQRSAFQKLSFMLELLHYYENQSTESPEVAFTQRLPVLVEQLVVSGTEEKLDEKQVQQAESLLAYIIHPDHRQAVINNTGKSGGTGRTLKYVLTLRSQKLPLSEEIMHHVIPEFVKHLIPSQKPPSLESLVSVMRLTPPDMQRLVTRAVMDCDRLSKDKAEALGKEIARELGLKGLEEQLKAELAVPPEVERQLAWEKIKDLISSRTDPSTVAAAIRNRLHAKYNADEIKQSWVALIEADPISLIRVFCHLPYLADGQTDPLARTVMETYISRLTHEKYAPAYHKVVSSLRNMFKANPNSPTLQTFLALVKWISQEGCDKLSADIGIQAGAH